MLDAYQPGYLAPMLRAEQDLVRARLAAGDGDPAAAASFAAAVGGPRELSTSYHLAHGLLGHAQYLTRTGDADGAAAALGEARDIAARLDTALPAATGPGRGHCTCKIRGNRSGDT